MREKSTIDRRRFLGRAAAVSAAVAAAPAVAWAPAHATPGGAPSQAPGLLPFVDHYKTNSAHRLSPHTNAAVLILSEFDRIWRTGSSWDDGRPRRNRVLRENMRYCVETTRERTDEEARQSFVTDRQHQSYAVIAGLGPLAESYRSAARAVTSITEAPDGTPDDQVGDRVPDDAPPGSEVGAGSSDSALGAVVDLVDTVRGPHSSGNPSKYTFQYPRPWRMTVDSEVADTGGVDAFGFPVYESEVVVAPQLLRQRSTTPERDGGYVSGHTNALYLAALAFAYAVPERFQELVTRAAEQAHYRIVSGMHSPVDVIGGRVLATALAAAILSDPDNAGLKAAAREQAEAFFSAQTDGTLWDHAHSGDDPYGDREANERIYRPKLTYVLPQRGRETPLTVPAGAEVLLETRQPYLDAEQRRAVLRGTALSSRYELLDGPEGWGRLDLFRAADGYGSFERDVRVSMDASLGGFHAADAWRNDIDGSGGLTKAGTGTLTLTGDNGYSGGTSVEEGTLVAASPSALGGGGVTVRGGKLRLERPLAVGGDYRQTAGSLAVAAAGHQDAERRDGDGDDGGRAESLLTVRGAVRIEDGAKLTIDAADAVAGVVHVIDARRLRGAFADIEVTGGDYTAVPDYTRRGLTVELR
ncbi:autotransporter-associated beta strand protein [Nocardiopsis sp. Huas11]|uniref:phosphatase PAP2 family protein n=1 Tax=Nocardiopsis sp. Huas11 TaxID=2183912 RepID=UPI000F22D62D|nr:phosphatase PAP2 family protein [Nocardiopsis sp. Huas11]RKS08068.1 autotransporter-associated beta strand protein [Nocardiopsis sp. Huas11]